MYIGQRGRPHPLEDLYTAERTMLFRTDASVDI